MRTDLNFLCVEDYEEDEMIPRLVRDNRGKNEDFFLHNYAVSMHHGKPGSREVFETAPLRTTLETYVPFSSFCQRPDFIPVDSLKGVEIYDPSGGWGISEDDFWIDDVHIQVGQNVFRLRNATYYDLTKYLHAYKDERNNECLRTFFYTGQLSFNLEKILQEDSQRSASKEYERFRDPGGKPYLYPVEITGHAGAWPPGLCRDLLTGKDTIGFGLEILISERSYVRFRPFIIDHPWRKIITTNTVRMGIIGVNFRARWAKKSKAGHLKSINKRNEELNSDFKKRLAPDGDVSFTDLIKEGLMSPEESNT